MMIPSQVTSHFIPGLAGPHVLTCTVCLRLRAMLLLLRAPGHVLCTLRPCTQTISWNWKLRSCQSGKIYDMVTTTIITNNTSMMMFLIMFSLVSVISVSAQGPQQSRDPARLLRRCFTCRSRGEKGDCRDPFIPPEHPEGADRRQSVNTAVAEIPCSTGWCSKVNIWKNIFKPWFWFFA